MILAEENLQNDLSNQKKILLKGNSFTPYLKWAPITVTKYKRIKGVGSSRNKSLVRTSTFDVAKAEFLLYEDILKNQINRGRNLLRKYNTSKIEIIIEKDEEGYESDNEEYKKDSATTASSVGNKTEHNLQKVKGNKMAIKPFKKLHMKH